MYGLVNMAVQELICTKFGPEVWTRIKSRAGVEAPEFSRMAPYPDEVTFKLVAATSQVLDIPPDQVLETFGEFWVMYTGRAGYGHLFTMTGGSLREFLYNLDNLHTRVGQNFKQLRPPSFRFDEEEGGWLRMHYESDRQGLCPMVVGLLRGLAQTFKTPVDITHPACQRRGAEHCEFLLSLQEPHG